jgi:hypothetical protein
MRLLGKLFGLFCKLYQPHAMQSHQSVSQSVNQSITEIKSKQQIGLSIERE